MYLILESITFHGINCELKAEKELEIIRLKNLLAEEQNEKMQLKQQIEDLVNNENCENGPLTSISFFSAPPDRQLLQQLDTLKTSIAEMKEKYENENKEQKKLIQEQKNEIDNLKQTISQKDNQISILTTEKPTMGLFSAIQTKVIHLAQLPPLSPQAAVNI